MPFRYTEDHCTGICLPDQWNNSLVIFLIGETSPCLMFQEAPQEDVDQLEYTKKSNNCLSRDLEGIIYKKRERAVVVLVKGRRIWGGCNNRLPIWKSCCKEKGIIYYSCPTWVETRCNRFKLQQERSMLTVRKTFHLLSEAVRQWDCPVSLQSLHHWRFVRAGNVGIRDGWSFLRDWGWTKWPLEGPSIFIKALYFFFYEPLKILCFVFPKQGAHSSLKLHFQFMVLFEGGRCYLRFWQCLVSVVIRVYDDLTSSLPFISTIGGRDTGALIMAPSLTSENCLLTYDSWISLEIYEQDHLHGGVQIFFEFLIE